MIVRPLRVRILDSGGAHLTVTSEVDPSSVSRDVNRFESIKGAIPVRPLRVRILDSGGAHLTVTSEVDPSVESLEEGRIQQPARSVRPKTLNLIVLPSSMPDKQLTVLFRRRSTFPHRVFGKKPMR
jgi:hypothetical protein